MTTNDPMAFRANDLSDIAETARLLAMQPPSWQHTEWASELGSLQTITEAASSLLGQYVDQFPRYASPRLLRLTSARRGATPETTLLEATGYAQVAQEAFERARVALASAHASLARIAFVEPAANPDEATDD